MSYNFFDDPKPSLPTEIDVTGGVVLQEGSSQGDLLTSAFPAGSVSVSILPPSGWLLRSVVWSNGGSGVFPVPAAGVEDVYSFTFTIAQPGKQLSNNGQFKIKKLSDGA